MKVSYNWLNQYIELDLPPEEIGRVLTMAGVEMESVTKVGDDYSIEFEITSNRGDCLSIIGIARELSALLDRELIIPQPQPKATPPPTSELTSVQIEARQLCPRYTAQVIRGVKVAPSPQWLASYLNVIGIRSVNNIVDITNFVTMECGQPLHAFDYDLLKENRIIVRQAAAGEQLLTIDAKLHQLAPDMLVIADAAAPVAIAGVMGGQESEVTERTTNVLIESAYFAPFSVRETSRRLALVSAASYRFERVVDPEMAIPASLRAAEMILDAAGGELAASPIDMNFLKVEKREARLRFSELERIVGISIPQAHCEKVLNRLGFATLKKDKSEIVVALPSHRPDVEREIDLIEEVARIHGFDKILSHLLPVSMAGEPRQVNLIRHARETLQSLGLHEVLTDCFLLCDRVGQFSLFSNRENIRVRNPVNSVRPLLRKSLIPGLVETVAGNQRHTTDATGGFFEISQVYLPLESSLPTELTTAAFGVAGKCNREQTFFYAKALAERLLDEFRLADEVETAASNVEIFDRDAALQFLCRGMLLGTVGLLSKEICDALKLGCEVGLCELDFDMLTSLGTIRRRFEKLQRYPAIVRDLAIVLDNEVPYQRLYQEIRNCAVPHLTSIDFFDHYCGAQVPAGKKSIAISLTFRDPHKTLAVEAVNISIEKILATLKKSINAKLRE